MAFFVHLIATQWNIECSLSLRAENAQHFGKISKLKRRLNSEWEKIFLEEVQKNHSQLPKELQCIKSKGGHFEYIL